MNHCYDSSCYVNTNRSKLRRRSVGRIHIQLDTLFPIFTLIVVSIFISYSHDHNVEALTTTTLTKGFHHQSHDHIHHRHDCLHLPKKIRTLHYASKNFNPLSSSPLPPSSSSNDEMFQKRSKSWVVIVDDEESIRLSIGNYLFQAGYSVTACSDAEALLEILSSISQGFDEYSNNEDGTFYEDRFPDAIICDIRMPGKGMDGLDLLTILKNPPSSSTPSSSGVTSEIVPSPSNDMQTRDWDFIRQQWKRIPIVLLTAKSMTQDRIEGYRRGADVYLSKPFSPEELLSILDNLIERTKVLSRGASPSLSSSTMGENSNNNGDEKRPASLRDLKGDLLEIKGLLKKKKKTRNLLRSAQDRRKVGDNRLGEGSSLPSSSALVPFSKSKRQDNINLYGNIIPQSELDDFDEQIELTPKEKEILNLISQGCTNSEIANRLENSSTTKVSRTISGLYTKTLMKTRTELVKWGIRMGYISTE